jgi:hypothetical protein
MRSGPTRNSLLTGACLLLVGTVILWAAAAHNQPNPQPVAGDVRPTVAAHRVTTDCYTPGEIARHYGWQGDWRDYMVRLQRLNGWDRWPMLNRGDEIQALDYRTHQNAHAIPRTQGRPGRGTPPSPFGLGNDGPSRSAPPAAPGHRSDPSRSRAGPVPGRPAGDARPAIIKLNGSKNGSTQSTNR